MVMKVGNDARHEIDLVASQKMVVDSGQLKEDSREPLPIELLHWHEG